MDLEDSKPPKLEPGLQPKLGTPPLRTPPKMAEPRTVGQQLNSPKTIEQVAVGSTRLKAHEERPSQSLPGSLKALVGFGITALALSLGYMMAFTPPAEESKYPNYHFVEEAAQVETLEGVTSWYFVPKDVNAANAAIVNRVTLAEADLADPVTYAPLTETIAEYRTSPTPEKLQAVNAALHATQVLPDPKVGVGLLERSKVAPLPPIETITPSLTEGREALLKNLVDGSSKMFSLFLFDNYAEDGDIVELIINNQPFTTVPLTHGGATLSVPIPSTGATTIALRGIHDGGGGITVSMESSAGSFHTRSLGASDVVYLGVVTPTQSGG